MKIQSTALLAAVFATAMAATSAFAENPIVGSTPMMPELTIVENAANSSDHKTFVAAVQAAGLAETLSGPGPFTVFAPTDEAFALIDPAAMQALMLPENQAQLAQVLSCHVVAGELFADDLESLIAAGNGSTVIETLGGCMLTARSDDGTIRLTDERGDVSSVTIADSDMSNGVLHVVDSEILPSP